MKELKELSKGEEIEVEVTIDEEEYREVLLDLILLEVKDKSLKTTKLQRRHSVCCTRNVPEDSKPMDLKQIQIRVGQPVAELEKSIQNIKSLKEALVGRSLYDSKLFELARTAKREEQRLSEIRRQLSEMEIFLDSHGNINMAMHDVILAESGFSEIRLKEPEEIPVMPTRRYMEGESSSESGESGHTLSSLSDDRALQKILAKTSDTRLPKPVKPVEPVDPARSYVKGGSSFQSGYFTIEADDRKDVVGFLAKTKQEASQSRLFFHEELMSCRSSSDSGWLSGERPCWSSCSKSDEEKYAKPLYSKKGRREKRKPNRKLRLRDYQKELAAPALEGKNTIIYAPTNSGKTFVAMEIMKRHLKGVENPKVIFIVDKVTLLLQRMLLFEEYLTNFNICRHSHGISLHRRFQKNDIVVLTAQLLVNALKAKSVSITDISLLVFDKCHHANKDHPYNKIMQAYLDFKINGSCEPKTLPQVIGLTASLGVGQSSKEEKAKEHVLCMCANLDASNISTVQECVEGLKKATGGDMLECRSVQVTRKPGIFEQEINKNMEEIEIFIKRSPPTTNREVESYRQWIEAVENDATELENNDYFICAQRLRRYHEALLINSNVRIKDAILNLDEYFNGLDQSKFTETECWLQKSFIKTKERIENHIQKSGTPENPLLKKLQEQIIGFHAKALEECQAIGILFTRTREYAYALKRWIENTEELSKMLRPKVLLGSAEMTQTQQEQVIQTFKEGTVNIIIATTVAEEGLDIPKCNYVIRYGVKGNEISFVQSRGRIRAEEGNYVHLSEAKSKGAEHEQRNQYREMLMQLAVQEAQKMDQDDFVKKIAALQLKSTRAVKKKREAEEKKRAQLKSVDQSVAFLCKKCKGEVCGAQDIRRFKEVHHVVINKDIYGKIDIKPHERPSTYDDIHIGEKIYCKKCGHDWGVIITVEGTQWPCLKIVSFLTTLNRGKVRKIIKKWKDLPYKIGEVTLGEMMRTGNDDAN